MAVFSLMEELRGAYIEAYINIGDTSSADFEDVLYSKFFCKLEKNLFQVFS